MRLPVVHPTAAELLEELRRPGESYESLAARLPISLSTVNRWKRQSPRDWDTTLTLLDQAGWLTPPRHLAAARAEAVEADRQAAQMRSRRRRPARDEKAN